MNTDESRSLLSQVVVAARQPAVGLVALACVLLGILIGFILFGEPHRISTVFKDSSLLEWATVGATGLVGFGAWKYARATHFHTLDRADEERSNYLLRRVEALSLMVYKLSNAKGGISSWQSMQQVRTRRALMQAVARSSIAAAQQEFGVITWADGDTLAFSIESRAKFAELLRYCESAVRTCATIIEILPDSVDPVTAEQEVLLEKFQGVSDETAEIAEDLIELVNTQMESLEKERIALNRKRGARSRVFNFDP